MDEICQRVQAETELPETTVVFFDPADESFWAYPARG
jgi:hypothetical protein